MQDSLKDLFDLVPPDRLRRSIQEVFFTWLIEEPVLPQNYKQVAQDFYFLLEMIEKGKEEVVGNSEQ
jgi:hypothetical protein